MEARNRVGTGLSYRPARLVRWNRFLGSKFKNSGSGDAEIHLKVSGVGYTSPPSERDGPPFPADIEETRK
jgi:hypothetical protein